MMKKIITIIILQLFVFIPPVTVAAEGNARRMASFPGGNEKFKEYIIDNIAIPKNFVMVGNTDTLKVEFVINTAGKPVGVEVKKTPDKTITNIVKEAFSKMPKWEVGVVDGEECSTCFDLSIPLSKDNNGNAGIDNASSVILSEGVTILMPKFPGGNKTLMLYLSKNIKYPAECEEKNIQGRVIVQFNVEKNGEIDNIRIVKSVHPLLDLEAVRVVKKMPRWEPGHRDGKPISVRYTLPITFRLPKDKPKTHRTTNFWNSKALK